MKKNMLKVFTMLSLVVMLAAGSVWAAAEEPFKINVPFEFSAGKQVLPAGEYVVRQVFGGSVVRIQAVEGDAIATVQTHSVQSKSDQSKARLVFRRYGDQYFLSQVFGSNDIKGRELSRSRREREFAKGSYSARLASEAEVVTVTGQ